MNKIISIFILNFCVVLTGVGQRYTDYIGAGHDLDIRVTASSYEDGQQPENTINGSGMLSKYFAAGRFLNQATFGGTKDEIDALVNSNLDYERWIDRQFNQSPDYLSKDMDEMWAYISQAKRNKGFEEEDIFGPYYLHFNYNWWTHYKASQDRLRHKVAYALSQILVISVQSELDEWGEAQSFYYDLLIKHAFGNYKDLLMDVTYSVPMGYYLSHYNNPKEIPERNIHPDENYAREIMQLFTIGLYELNQDGSRKLDSKGKPIPTYGQKDIKEFAQVFTGLGQSAIAKDLRDRIKKPRFGRNIFTAQRDTFMVMYEKYHDTSQKELLNGYTIPAGNRGDEDIRLAIDHLFNHPNVGPFISRQLIQRLIKSNPSANYISRVAAAFNDNGSGVRGDMKAVVKAILLDPEAREGAYILENGTGRLREPLLRVSNLGKSIGITNKNDLYWHNGINDYELSGQGVLASPTVFNFYAPDFAPNGEIKEAGLVAPEFQLHNTSKAVTYLNGQFDRTFWGIFGYSWEYSQDELSLFDSEEDVVIRLTDEWLYDYADDPEELMDQIDILMTHGQLTDRTRKIIRTALDEIVWPWDVKEQNKYRVKMALFLTQLSPDFAILK